DTRDLHSFPTRRSSDLQRGNAENVGKIVEIKGVVIDVVFPHGLPEILSALRVEAPEQDGRPAISLIAEVQQHLGDDRVRAVAMRSEEHTSELQSRGHLV